MVRLHAARHTAITMMLALGIQPQVVKEMAGHAKFTTTEGYVDKVDELHLDAAEQMAAFWD
jgi:site-specific recombinase XerD